IASLFIPSKVDLGAGVRLAIYDPATGDWSALYNGPMDAGDVHIIAANNTHVYVRGYTFTERITRIVKITLDGSEAPVTLLTRSGVDSDIDEPGATDGTNIYFWSYRDSGHRLLSLSTSGGEPITVFNNGFGPGLTYSDGQLYWARQELNLVKLPVGGGSPTVVRANVFATAAVGGLPIDDTSIYVAVLASRTEMRILRIDP
ncbi:MAG: hypothetical protein ACO1SX_15060, partial [Actinomycetota bacterium]